jgi:transcriptional regulator with XRE-family HTH domain
VHNEIGQRLKSIRTRLKLSQRQLARQSGVANATISQVEAGKLNPTVSMLKKVLDGIPVSLSEFFGDSRAIQLLQECYQPGSGTGRHAMTHEGEECGIILSGRLEVTVGDETSILSKGDAYYFKSNQPHQFRNPGSEPCELISACTPPTF